MRDAFVRYAASDWRMSPKGYPEAPPGRVHPSLGRLRSEPLALRPRIATGCACVRPCRRRAKRRAIGVIARNAGRL